MKILPHKRGLSSIYKFKIYVPAGLAGNHKRRPYYFEERRSAEAFLAEMNARKRKRMVHTQHTISEWLEATGESS
jgi:hypothetical protein